MKKYWAIAKSTWQEYLAYRLNLFLEVMGGIIMMLVVIALWYTIFKGLGKETIGDFTLAQMITYLIGAGIINSFLWAASQGDEINDDINSGDLSNYLVKPVNVVGYWLTRDACRKFMTFLLGVAEFIIILFFFKNFLVGPSSFIHLVLALAAIIIASLIHFIIFYLFSVIAFWLEQTWGTRFVIRVVMEIATGSLIPLSLFPGTWQTIVNILPFKYLVYFPLQIYLGKIPLNQISYEFLIALAWLAAFIIIGVFVWKRGVRHYAAEGR